MALKSIEQEWEGFAAMVLEGRSPSETQRNEMKKAFFAGFAAMAFAIEEIGEPHVPEDKAFEYIEAIRAEAKSFVDQITKEYLERTN